MTAWLTLMAVGLLVSLGAALVRVWHGPDRADRMIGVQLAGTSGVAVLVLLAPVEGWVALNVALILALFAALAAVGFVKSASTDGGGDPEEGEDPVEPRPVGRNADG